MKSFLRKTEYYTSYNANTPVELDSEKFPDFKGETEEEFLQYIYDNLDEWVDSIENGEELSFDQETQDALYDLKNGNFKEKHSITI